MSAAKTLVIRFEEWERFKNRVKTALRDGKPSVAAKNMLVFDYNRIEIHMPQVTYSHNLGGAA